MPSQPWGPPENYVSSPERMITLFPVTKSFAPFQCDKRNPTSVNQHGTVSNPNLDPTTAVIFRVGGFVYPFFSGVKVCLNW